MRDIVVYKCTVCDREVQLQRKPESIETVGHCIITANCRGRLYIERVIQTTEPFLQRTAGVVGLDNFFQRPKLFRFTQRFERQIWYISHNLGVIPSVSVYDTNSVLLSDSNFELTVIDSNTVTLDFGSLQAGTAELFTRELSIPNVSRGGVVQQRPVQISTNTNLGTITILTRKPRPVPTVVFDVDGVTPLIDEQNQPIFSTEDDTTILKFTAPSGSTQLNTVDVMSNSAASPWAGNREVIIRNQTFYIGFIDIFSNGFNQSLISTGTTISIVSSDQDISHILIASSPFERVDIIKNQIISLNSINSSLFFDNSEIFCDNDSITRIYPSLILS